MGNQTVDSCDWELSEPSFRACPSAFGGTRNPFFKLNRFRFFASLDRNDNYDFWKLKRK